MSKLDINYEERKNCELILSTFDKCNKNWNTIIRIKDHETNLGDFDVIFCDKCKLGFTNPFPTEETSHLLYDTKDSSDFDLIKHTYVDHLKDTLAKNQVKKMVPIANYSEIKRILDYGTGNGRYAVAAKEAFPISQVDAVDYQQHIPPYLIKYSKKIRYFNMEEFGNNNITYDLIILRHVLEHTYHPVQFLKKLGEHLTINGILYIEVPNLESGCAKIFRKYWKGYYVPRHIFHYTIKSLQTIINLAGLQGTIHRNEMPLMGNTLAIMTNTNPTSLVNRTAGILLHPLQLFIEFLFKSSTCINAKCRLNN